MEYINNDKNNGINYDFDLIAKEYKKLKCPKGFFNLCDTNIKNCGWTVVMSERATSGKTTNVLLFGMIFYKLYSVVTCYTRQFDFMVEKKMLNDMFDVILENHYIEKIFDGKWNHCFLHAGRWYLCKVDETGEITEKDNNPFCRCFSVQSYSKYKSTVNSYSTDFVVFDEFVSNRYQPDEFEHFNDLLATLFRLRISGRVVLLSNTVDPYSQYFKELCIFDDIIKMEFGDSKTIKSPLGTMVDVHFLKAGKVQHKMRNEQIKMFFGFPNPKLANITGSATWAIRNYNHIPKEIEWENEIVTNRYLEFNGRLIRVRCVNDSKRGICICFTKATNKPDDVYIYTIEELLTKFHKYKLGNNKVDKFIWLAVANNRAYYDTNETGYVIERYINACKEL